jgi:hypothetical protein
VTVRKILLALVFSTTFMACKRNEGNIVITGQQNSDQLTLFRTDTFTLKAATVLEDSLPANNLTYALLGEFHDPLLGKSKASIYAKMNILAPENNFPNTIEPDSALLYIPLVDGLNFYGNQLTKQKIKIYELDEALIGSSIYYQKQSKPKVKNNPTTDYYGSIYRQKIDSIRYQKGKMGLKPGLLIKLSKEFARELQTMPSEAYQTNEGLLKHFKGIAIVPQNDELNPEEGGFGVLDLANAININYRAKILLYYNDTSTYIFGFDGRSSIVNTSETGPYPEIIEAQLRQPTKHYNTTYVQALNGLKTKIEIPYLLNLVQSGTNGENNVGINNATLRLYVDENTNVHYFAPPRMNLFQPTSRSSDRNRLVEDALASPTKFGGVFNDKGRYYQFDITRHLQNVLNDMAFKGIDNNLGLYFAVPTDNPVIGARAAIDHSKTKLIITYTKPK